jgi:hypothetical protein
MRIMFVTLCWTCLTIGTSMSAAAQGASPTPAPAGDAAHYKASWEIEPFGGGGFARGGGFLATADEDQFSIPTNSGKAPSSWFLGSIATVSPVHPLVPLTSLLPVVGGPDIRQPTRGAFGVRVTRWGGPHVGLDFVASGVAGPPERLGGADIEQSRASFVSTFGALFAASPQLYGAPTVTAATTTQTSVGGEFDSTAALILTKASGRIRPYVTAGGGERWTLGSAESVNVTGRYTFTTPSGAPIDERDSVTILYHQGASPIMAFSGGARIVATAHAGLRVDARITLGKDRDAVSVDATPTSEPGTPAGFVLQPGTRTNPPLVFSNTPSQPTTLRGPAISNVPTAIGTGVRRTWTVTAGWFWTL